jgi:diacylglycerol O-acyltransferase / wax synthase
MMAGPATSRTDDGRNCVLGRPRPGSRKLAPADEANLVLDHAGQVNVFLVAGVLAPLGFATSGRPDLPALRGVLAERIEELPALRIVPRRAVRGHRWVERGPDLEHHVRLVEPVEGRAGLERLCGSLMSVPLDRDRPLWEMLVVPMVGTAGVGIVLRVHHAIADGMAAVDIVQHLFDHQSGRTSADDGGATRQRPARGLWRTLTRITFAFRRILLTLRATGVRPTVLLGERSPGRSVIFVDGDLATLDRRARLAGATLNDVLLAAVSSGYRAALTAASEPLPDWLPVSVPVALRRGGASANQVGVMRVRLPTGEADVDCRLRLIAAQTSVEKIRARDQGTLELMRGPLGAHLMDRLAQRQHLVAGFVTNVPGPARPMLLAGAPIEAMWPVAVLAANVRLGVAAVSYAGRLWCSVEFDDEGVPGAEFARAMGVELNPVENRPLAE